MRNAVLDEQGYILNVIEGAVPGLRCVEDPEYQAVIGGRYVDGKFLPPEGK